MTERESDKKPKIEIVSDTIRTEYGEFDRSYWAEHGAEIREQVEAKKKAHDAEELKRNAERKRCPFNISKTAGMLKCDGACSLSGSAGCGALDGGKLSGKGHCFMDKYTPCADDCNFYKNGACAIFGGMKNE